MDDLLFPMIGTSLWLRGRPSNCGADLSNVEIMAREICAGGLVTVLHHEGRRLAQHSYIGLSGGPEREDTAPFDGFARRVERDHGAVAHIFRHGPVRLDWRIR